MPQILTVDEVAEALKANGIDMDIVDFIEKYQKASLLKHESHVIKDKNKGGKPELFRDAALNNRTSVIYLSTQYGYGGRAGLGHAAVAILNETRAQAEADAGETGVVLDFGKYNGKTVEEVFIDGPSYLLWLLTDGNKYCKPNIKAQIEKMPLEDIKKAAKKRKLSAVTEEVSSE